MPVEPATPRTYREKWEHLPVTTSVEDFYEEFPPDGSKPALTMFDQLLKNDNRSFPCGLLVLAELPNVTPRVMTLHEIHEVPSVIGQKTNFGGRVLGVQNDVAPTGGITMRVLDAKSGLLAKVTNVLVPLKDQVTTAFERPENAGQEVLQPMAADDSTEEITVYKSCPVPLQIMLQTIDKLYTPLELYEKLVHWNTIQSNPSADLPVLGWLRSCFTLQGTEKTVKTKIGYFDTRLPRLLGGLPENVDVDCETFPEAPASTSSTICLLYTSPSPRD